jgi:2-polyprenyl-6-hydroxyphenyl methylase / 3-demethylubiquinone-9 3-methyltransferase
MPHMEINVEPVIPKTLRLSDNTLYEAEEETWWEADSVFYPLRTSINPVRTGYARKVFFEKLGIDPEGKTALEVGCGGGVLTEEIAGMGWRTTGIDPSKHSLIIARRHSQISGLDIRYDHGFGETLPYSSGSFDAVFCCDVLEHVQDLPKVIAEISRVLKDNGVFYYDTFNRTWISKLAAIKVCQDWKPWAILPHDFHVWEKFIKPKEMISLLRQNRMEWQEHRGIKLSVSIPRILTYLRRRSRSIWTYKELGESFILMESGYTGVMYLGYAIKTPENVSLHAIYA